MHTVLATWQRPTLILAQEDGPQTAPGTDAGTTPDATTSASKQDANTNAKQDETPSLFGDPTFLMLMIGMAVLWIFLLGGGSRKQKKKQQQMLASMSKGSKVVTIGGIRGSVVEVRDDEVIVKVDENNNTRMKFSKDAIRTVLSEGHGVNKDGASNTSDTSASGSNDADADKGKA